MTLCNTKVILMSLFFQEVKHCILNVWLNSSWKEMEEEATI